jgi:formamidopyrimidine-DNA glycosylase
MPEGPEVWILSKAVNEYFENENTYAIGKHLILQEEKENWSFGLQGSVYIDPATNKLEKRFPGFVTGSIEPLAENLNLGVNWMTASLEELQAVVNTIRTSKSKKKLAQFLLDQKLIAGIGVAWGSEILAKAHLNPAECVQKQDFSTLATVLLEVRNEIAAKYLDYLAANTIKTHFINNWFGNLYCIRKMQVYKVGNIVEVGGRKWWTKD